MGMPTSQEADLTFDYAGPQGPGPWRGIDDLEYATLEWVDWFNHHRLFSAIGYVPPAEYETNLYGGTVPAEAGTQ